MFPLRVNYRNLVSNNWTSIKPGFRSLKRRRTFFNNFSFFHVWKKVKNIWKQQKNLFDQLQGAYAPNIWSKYTTDALYQRSILNLFVLIFFKYFSLKKKNKRSILNWFVTDRERKERGSETGSWRCSSPSQGLLHPANSLLRSHWQHEDRQGRNLWTRCVFSFRFQPFSWHC